MEKVSGEKRVIDGEEVLVFMDENDNAAMREGFAMGKRRSMQVNTSLQSNGSQARKGKIRSMAEMLKS